MPLRPQTRRIFLALAFLVVIAALVFLPPYINGERYRHRIADSMSQALGRPVHIDTVTFHILPTTGITLGGFVVDENPAFGNEPVIRANVVEATLRLSSLWRRQIEISRLDFEVDDNGAGPSVNIVRNAQGRWNLQDILVQAAHANTAPTTQAKHGRAPRFPYIEATGARVNLKLGDEKMPFSLVDADFALWSPEPQQWQVRLKARPARTDTNASDTGVMTLEGTLGRAASLPDVPVNLTASWAHVPLGEATRVLTGDDQQWRGVLEAGATLAGTVGAARLETTVHLTDLRRADFVPADLLDVSAHCTAAADLTHVQLTGAACTLPTGGPAPLTFRSSAIDMQHPAAAAATLTADQVPLTWLYGWAHLFTLNLPAAAPAGTLDGQLTHTAAATDSPAQWHGSLTANLTTSGFATTQPGAATIPVQPGLAGGFSPLKKATTDEGFSPGLLALNFALENAPALTLTLAPTPLRAKNFTATLAGSADPSQFTLNLTGAATADAVKAFGNSIYRPLGDDLAATMKSTTPDTIVPIDIACQQTYGNPDNCQAILSAIPKKFHRKH